MQVGQQYRSNKGKGPYRAEVVAILDSNRVVLERWREASKKPLRERFTLTARFIDSPACGWHPVPASGTA